MITDHPFELPLQPAGESVQVELVTMPYAHLMRPSIALGILKACLEREGLTAHVTYGNLRFAEAAGIEVSNLMMYLRTDSLIGEWTFAAAAFRDGRDNLEALLGSARRVQPPNLPRVSLDESEFAGIFRQVRAFAPIFIDQLATEILERKPRIVGCTSTFEQHCPSLALLRRIKELAPETVTLLGGANCEMEMGWTTLSHCDWIDCVISGEADLLIGPLCRELLLPEADRGRLPEGVMTRAHVRLGRDRAFPAGKLPRAVVSRMNESPAPDFDDYFEQLENSPLRQLITPALAVESSRGCWWGEKSHCTFCGLNGMGMNYRAKDAGQVLEEWRQLQAKYPVRKMTVVDNIIDRQHIRDLLPQLASAGAPYELFYETKANLRRDQVQLMAQAGITKFQPGIEGLHNDLLKLMAKGNSAMINLQLLKFAREYGIMTTWMMLVGFPDEDPAWHAEVAEWLPAIFHLQPPNGVVHIRYDRFSVYFNAQESHGLNLEPFPAYREVYPFPEAALREVAYFFYDANRQDPGRVAPEIQKLGDAVRDWVKAYHRPVRPLFCVTDREETLEFFDTRPGAQERRARLTGLARDIYLACDTAMSLDGLQARFGEGAIVEIESMVARRLLLRLGDQLLALACYGEIPALVEPPDFPSGHVAMFNPEDYPNAAAAWRALKAGFSVGDHERNADIPACGLRQ